MDLPQAPPTTGDASPSSGVVNVTVGVVEDQPSNGDVAAVISATIPSKRKRIPKVFFKEAAAGAAPAATPAAAAKGGRVKTKAAGPRGAQPKAKKPTTRVGLAAPPSKAATLPAAAAAAVPPAPTPPVADARQVLDDEPTTTYMDMLNAGTVDLDAGIGAFDEGSNYDYGDYGDDEEGDEEVDDDVVEVDPAAAGSSAPPKQRTSNYTEIEDVTLVRAWGKVGMDAGTGTDQTGKRYWQRIEDVYHQLKPRTKSMADRSYRSLEGRWNTIKPACSRWSAAMDQVADNPPSGCVMEDYVSFLN